MGNFFSLRGADEWEQEVRNLPAPSIWSHASFSPLCRDQKVLLERSFLTQPLRVGRSEMRDGLKIGEDIIILGGSPDVSMLVCFEERTGRFYSALLFGAQDGSPHRYQRARDEVVSRPSRATETMRTSVRSAASTLDTTARSFVSTARDQSVFKSRSLCSTGGSGCVRSGPLLPHASLSSVGRLLLDGHPGKDLFAEAQGRSLSLCMELYTVDGQVFDSDDITALARLLPSFEAIELMGGYTHPWAEQPKTVGALAAAQLAALANADDDNRGLKATILASGAIPPLVKMLCDEQQDRVHAAVVAIGLLAAGPNLECVRALNEAGAKKGLMRLMTSSAFGVQHAAAAALCNVERGTPLSGSAEWLAPTVHTGPDAFNMTSLKGSADGVVLKWLTSLGLREKGLELSRGKQTLSRGGGLALTNGGDRRRTETTWQYCLMYNVKEGVLVYFSNDRDSCVEVSREIAVAYAALPRLVGGRPSEHADGTGYGTAAAANLAAAMKVKCLDLPLGRPNGPITDTMTTLVMAELGRHFAMRCDANEQESHTNCVAFIVRTVIALALTFRGLDIRRICAERGDLGRKAGEAAAKGWETLWYRCGANRCDSLSKLVDEKVSFQSPSDERKPLASSQSAPSLRKKGLPDACVFDDKQARQLRAKTPWERMLDDTPLGSKQMFSTYTSMRRLPGC